LIEKAANKLVYCFFQGAKRRLLLVFEFIVFQVDGAFLQFFFFPLHVLFIVELDDLFVETRYSFLVDAIVPLGVD
jgi:hypothetical protein